MKNIWKKWNDINLVIRILCGIVLGAVLAVIAVACGIEAELSFIGILGTLFVGALKAMAPILVFVLIISSIATAKSTAPSTITPPRTYAIARKRIFSSDFGKTCVSSGENGDTSEHFILPFLRVKRKQKNLLCTSSI